MATNARALELIEIGDKLFSGRSMLMSLWQDIADHFHPERADFTATRQMGDDFAGHLMTGYSALQLRELSDQLAAMLRPRQTMWAKIAASNARIDANTTARKWLEWATGIQHRAMYASGAHFLRATKTGDRDFVSFGQCVIRPSLNSSLNGLLYRAYHLRDTAWCEDSDGNIESVHRIEKQPARLLVQMFGDKVPEAVRNAAKQEPYKELECRHIVVPADQYDLGKQTNDERFPFRSLYILKDDCAVLEAIPARRLGYVIPRWNLGSNGQYAVSPVTMLALPDSRLLQQMTTALLEAGERAATPPLIATHEVVRSDIQNFPGGVTWVDRAYDEKLGEALRPVEQQLQGINYGLKMLEDVREMMKQTFFLNKLNLPEFGSRTTAFEVQKVVEEYARGALPLFEPMENEYNAALCNETFDLLMENGAFGNPEDMPEVLRGADVRFEFESPLQASADRAKAQIFMQYAEMQSIAAKLDPTTIHAVDVQKAYSDALDGIEVPADWKRDPAEVEQLVAAQQEVMAQQNELADVRQWAGTAEQAGRAVNEVAGIRSGGGKPKTLEEAAAPPQ